MDTHARSGGKPHKLVVLRLPGKHKGQIDARAIRLAVKKVREARLAAGTK